MATATTVSISLTEAQRRFRDNVKFLADIGGLTVNRAAGIADLAPQTVRNWMAGKADPTLCNMEKIAEALGVEVSDLLLPGVDLQEKVAAEGLRPFVLRARRPAARRLATGGRARDDDPTANMDRVKRTLRKSAA